MPSFNLVVPEPILSVEIRPTEVSEENPSKVYKRAFNAGYQAGMLQARLEIEETKRKYAQQFEALFEQFGTLLPEWKNSVVDVLSELFMHAFEQLYATFRPSPENLAHEIKGFLNELTHAAQITIHLPPEELEAIQNLLKEVESSHQQGAIQWHGNPELEPGEFLLQSDLGQIDGRNITRLHRVRSILTTSATK